MNEQPTQSYIFNETTYIDSNGVTLEAPLTRIIEVEETPIVVFESKFEYMKYIHSLREDIRKSESNCETLSKYLHDANESKNLNRIQFCQIIILDNLHTFNSSMAMLNSMLEDYNIVIESGEDQNKIHSREEVKVYFKDDKRNKLSDADCRVIIEYLMEKYDLKINQIGNKIDDVIKDLKGGEKLHFNGGFLKITLSCFENYDLFLPINNLVQQ